MFGAAPVIQVWINGDDAENVAGLAAKVNELLNEKEGLKAVVIETDAKQKEELAKLETGKASVAYLPADARESVMKAFKIGDAKNTVIVYKNKQVEAVFENVSAKHFDKVAAAARAL